MQLINRKKKRYIYFPLGSKAKYNVLLTGQDVFQKSMMVFLEEGSILDVESGEKQFLMLFRYRRIVARFRSQDGNLVDITPWYGKLLNFFS